MQGSGTGSVLTLGLCLLILHAHNVPERRTTERRELCSRLRAFSLLALLLDERASLAGEHGKVTCRVAHGVDRLQLLRKHRPAVEEGRLEVVHHHVYGGLRLVLEVEVDLLPRGDTGGDHSVGFPQVVVSILHNNVSTCSYGTIDYMDVRIALDEQKSS